MLVTSSWHKHPSLGVRKHIILYLDSSKYDSTQLSNNATIEIMTSVGSHPHTEPPTHLQNPKLRFCICILRAIKSRKTSSCQWEDAFGALFFSQPTNDLDWNLGTIFIFQPGDNFVYLWQGGRKKEFGASIATATATCLHLSSIRG